MLHCFSIIPLVPALCSTFFYVFAILQNYNETIMLPVTCVRCVFRWNVQKGLVINSQNGFGAFQEWAGRQAVGITLKNRKEEKLMEVEEKKGLQWEETIFSIETNIVAIGLKLRTWRFVNVSEKFHFTHSFLVRQL